MLANKLMSALSGGAEDKLYVDDVFSAYTYTGNGSTQTINNGIDLAGKGGMVWARARDSANAGHFLSDTVRGINNVLASQNNLGNGAATYYTGVTSSGFGLSSNAVLNGTGGAGFGKSYISWTFRKAPKFFDVVQFTYSGDAVPQTITHNLGSIPGMILVKKTSDIGSWYVYHRGLPTPTDNYLLLEGTPAYMNFAGIWGTGPTATDFQVNGVTTGGTYVAYLFAHDPSADGIIQCGIMSGPTTINLGWEPQFLLMKKADGTGAWGIYDSMRGWTAPPDGGFAAYLEANTFMAEYASSFNTLVRPVATGMSIAGIDNYIYLAIRRPNKPPTTGTEVYSHLTRTGSGAVGSTAAVGFAPDLAISQSISVGRSPIWVDRLRGVKQWLHSDAASAEGTQTSCGLSSFDMFGVSYTADNTEQPFAWNNSGEAKHQRFFRRAPGFMDVVCYTGTGVAGTVPHSLGVAPELMIAKSRTAVSGWLVYVKDLGPSKYLRLDSTSTEIIGSTVWNNTSPTNSLFSHGGSAGWSGNNVAYLFASLPGISKVGSYIGNGATQTINCGFTTGARFILIKRTNSAGDWYVWDTARGIVAGDDPHLSLNTTAAEVTTDDSVDPDVSGFIVNQVAATNINVSGGQYIFLAIA